MSTTIQNYFRRKNTRLNGAFLLTTLGDRMWMFALGIFMHKLGGMRWVAAQQFFDAFIKLLSLPILGSMMDKRDRNRIMQLSLLVNNIAVSISAALFCFCFTFKDNSESKDLGQGIIFFLLAIVFTSISRLASEAQRICFTKDWIVVITNSYPEEEVSLSQQNSYMFMIDQFASIILPPLTGFMFDVFGRLPSSIFIIIYNLCSWYVESNILRQLYNLTPTLQHRTQEENAKDEVEDDETKSTPWLRSIRLYFKQTSWMAGLGLALLYMTVLGFDNLAGSYAQKHGMSLIALGFLRSIGSGLGVLGAATYGRLTPLIGVLWTAFIGLTWQNVFILTSGISTLLPGSPMNISGFVDSFNRTVWTDNIVQQFHTPDNTDHTVVPFLQLPTSILVFFLGITIARYGLWIADPAITQIQQETIPESQRYSVFSIQTAFCEAFSLLKDTIVILLPHTELFGGLAICSCLFVFTGYMLFNIYFIKCGCSTQKNAHIQDENSTELQIISSPKIAEEKTLLNSEASQQNSVE